MNLADAYKVNLVKQIILLACKLGGVRLMSDIELERRRYNAGVEARPESIT